MDFRGFRKLSGSYEVIGKLLNNMTFLLRASTMFEVLQMGAWPTESKHKLAGYFSI